MAISLDRIDAAPILYGDFDNQLLQWLWGFIDSQNEVISNVESAFNILTAISAELHTESVTLTTGSPTFTVADGSIYRVGYIVIGQGIPDNTNISSINANTITLDANATATGANNVTFVPLQGDIKNGVFIYDTTNNVYVGKQNGLLIKFTTTAYP